ncbi:MAG: tRNA (adenosine(37)-N6)-threonylcarbamoyltransferase complex transferase subunit TsaD [bacterium]
MIVLGIESSCDETAAGIVSISDDLVCTLHANAVLTSMDLHAAYGGVVPEIAAREHIKSINPVIEQAFTEAGMTWDDIDAIAVTNGAGLGGSLLVGVITARTLAIIKNKPLYAINHVEAHVYANFITKIGDIKPLTPYLLPPTSPVFPMLALIVSGGHSQLVLFNDHFDYKLLGQTQDDAIGEAFDKVAKILGLSYPGGPSVGTKALKGNSKAFSLPKAKMPNKYDYSFSGLKTAVLRQAQAMCGKDFTFPSSSLPDALTSAQKADIAAVFQRIAIETVVDKTIMAYEEFQPASVVIGGGVSASTELRRQLADRLPIEINYTDPKLSTDNGAMIATLGAFKAKLAALPADPYNLDINPNLSM